MCDMCNERARMCVCVCVCVCVMPSGEALIESQPKQERVAKGRPFKV